MRYLKFSLLLLLLCTTNLYANTCKRFVVAGVTDWQPYTKNNISSVTGIAPELANIIFSDLDIPVVYAPIYNNNDLIETALQHGYVDVFIISKKPNTWYEFADFLPPSYAEDAMMVMLAKSSGIRVDEWQDLMGMIGVTAHPYYYEPRIERVVDDYLYVERVDAIKPALESLQEGDVEYVLDSRDRINVAMQDMQKKYNITRLNNSFVYEPLYFGIGKNSACADYAWYIQAKLAQLEKDGTIAALIHKHYPSLVPEPVGIEEDGVYK